MELTKKQMEKVLYELRCAYNSRINDDEDLYEIINLFKKYLNSGETKSYTDVRSLNTWGMMVFILFIMN